jgi:cytochrome c-type biogenesis protein
LFGFALSLPLAVAVLIPAARRALDWLARLSGRIPLWTGIVLIALGIWSIWFGLFVEVRPT